MQCEICAKIIEKGKRIRLEGSVVTACEDCSSYGTVVEDLSSKKGAVVSKNVGVVLKRKKETLKDYEIKFEEEFINFFNNSTSITPRMHALKLLPGIGQKHMWEILEARERQRFGTFQDIIDRTSISNPTKLIAQRIIKELQRDVKYYLFSKTQKYE